MSHNICYRSYLEKCDPKKVKAELDHYVAMEDWQEGCSGLSNIIRWYGDVKPLDGYDAAKEFIDAHDRRNYDNLAVRYYAYDNPETQKRKDLAEAMKTAHSVYQQRCGILYPATLSSEFIGCKHCGSKLARKFLLKNTCPICGHDLRTKTMLNAIDTAKKRWQKAQEDYEAYVKTAGKKKVMWLVKFEYHT